jgi:hypothetical protein
LQDLDPLFGERPAIFLVPELAHDVDVGGPDARVDPRLRGFRQRFAARFNVGSYGAGEAANRRAAHLARNQIDGAEILRGRSGIAGFDHVHFEKRQLPGDCQLLFASKTRSGGLLAISQAGVEDSYFIGHLRAFGGVGAGSGCRR